MQFLPTSRHIAYTICDPKPQDRILYTVAYFFVIIIIIIIIIINDRFCFTTELSHFFLQQSHSFCLESTVETQIMIKNATVADGI